MSSSLGWLPVKPEDWEYLDTDLKFAMRKRFGDPIHTKLSAASIPYLEGLKDAGIKDAKILIKAIRKHGDIEVKEVWG